MRTDIRATCDQCGYGGSLDALRLHSCQIQQQGGRCEDYPCCGHTDGDGCQTLPEHTSEYWSEVLQDPRRAHLFHEPGSPEWHDALDERDEVFRCPECDAFDPEDNPSYHADTCSVRIQPLEEED